MVLIWVSAREDLPRTFSILNLVVCILDVILFWLVGGKSIVNVFAWFIFILEIVRLLVAILLFYGVKQRDLERCKTWCVAELVLLILQIFLLIFGFYNIGLIIWSIIVIVLRVYGLYIIVTFVRVLQVEIGEDTSVFSNFCPTPFRNIFQRNTSTGGTTQPA